MTLIPGDGTGPELTAATRRVLDATGVELEWSEHDIGLPTYRETGDPLPASVLESIRRDGVALKGPVSTPKTGEFRSVNIELRRSLDLFAQVRPCKSFVGAFSPFPAVDVVVVREASEDLYAGIEYEGGSEDAEELVRWLAAHDHASVRPGAAIAVKPISEWASRRIFRFAFEYARAHGRRRVTAVHKATVMKHTDGIFVHAARELAGEYPDLVVDDISVDTLCLHLVRKPEEFDVLVAPNLYADIVSDLAAGLVGGLGLAPGGNYGDEVAVFEAAHGTAPRHAGRGVANPIALILSGALLLRQLGESSAAERVERSVAGVIESGYVTYDLRADRDERLAARTDEVVEAIVERLDAAD